MSREGARPPGGTPAGDGPETILVVEDEEALLPMICELLEAGGYRVLAASLPAQALSLARSEAGQIHLLLSDLVMPGCDGRELAAELRAARPALKVLFMSGYLDAETGREAAPGPSAPFIQKPFGGELLLRRVRDVLDGEAPPGRA